MSSASKKLRRSARKLKLSSKKTTKSKINKNAVFTIPISQRKQVSSDSSLGPLSWNLATTNVTGYTLTSITQGDQYNERTSNNIRVRALDLQFSFNNFHTSGRYVRIMVVGLRGSVNSADTTNWNDIYRTPSTFAKVAPASTTMDMLNNVNKDEYKLILDEIHHVPGTNNGVPTAKKVHIRKKMSNLVQYAFNSTDARDGVLYLVVNPAEDPGVTPNANVLSMHYRFTTWFNDVRN